MRNLVLLLSLFLLVGCGSVWNKQQTLRLIHDDVPVGVKMMQSDAQDAGKGTSLYYNNIDSLTAKVFKENYERGLITSAEYQAGMDWLKKNKEGFKNAQKPLTRIDIMGNEVLYGMGWEEGLRDPLVPLEAFGIGVGTGIAGAAMF